MPNYTKTGLSIYGKRAYEVNFMEGYISECLQHGGGSFMVCQTDGIMNFKKVPSVFAHVFKNHCTMFLAKYKWT